MTNVEVTTQIIHTRHTVNCTNDKYTGKNITIAFLDTGICNIYDFHNRIIYFKDFVNQKKSPYDDNGHGCHVAGISSGNGKYKGIAPDSNIIMLKTLNGEGKGNAANVLSGIKWIENNHKKFNIKIVNMSIGTGAEIPNDPLVMAVEALWKKGIVVVTAAGNNGPNPGTISSPGTSKIVITVGASDDESDQLKNFSGRGPTRENIMKPDLVAPGNNIFSCQCNGDYKSLSGTSMSTPIVSGAVALLLEKAPDLSPDDIKYMLKLSSTELELPQNRQGWGLLNIKKLLEMELVYVRQINS